MTNYNLIRVYVAGPMKLGNYSENIRIGMKVCDCIASQGFAVFNPFLSHFWNLMYPHDGEFWMEQDFTFLSMCNLFVRILSDTPSEGADREEARAKELGIPVLHWNAGWEHMSIVPNKYGGWDLL